MVNVQHEQQVATRLCLCTCAGWAGAGGRAADERMGGGAVPGQ